MQIRLSLKAELQQCILLEARRWRKLCKNQWLLDGDENTVFFFHKTCLAGRRYNFIAGIKNAEGSSFYSDADIEKALC